MNSVVNRNEVFFITDIPLLILEIALSTCCLNLSFSSSIIPGCFYKMLFQLENCRDLSLDDFETAFSLRMLILGLVY